MPNALRHSWNFVESAHFQTPPRMQQLVATFHTRKCAERTLKVTVQYVQSDKNATQQCCKLLQTCSWVQKTCQKLYLISTF